MTLFLTYLLASTQQLFPTTRLPRPKRTLSEAIAGSVPLSGTKPRGPPPKISLPGSHPVQSRRLESLSSDQGVVRQVCAWAPSHQFLSYLAIAIRQRHGVLPAIGEAWSNQPVFSSPLILLSMHHLGARLEFLDRPARPSAQSFPMQDTSNRVHKFAAHGVL